MTDYRIDNGLIVSGSDERPQLAGYVFDFTGHGAFEPSGKVGNLELSKAQIAEHNRLLGEMELQMLQERGRGMAYLTERDGKARVSLWAGTVLAEYVHVQKSWHNFAGRDGRRDVWFYWEGAQWHGVNVGDNQILRVRRNKRPAIG